MDLLVESPECVRSGLLFNGSDMRVDMFTSEFLHLILDAVPVNGSVVPALAFIINLIDALQEGTSALLNKAAHRFARTCWSRRPSDGAVGTGALRANVAWSTSLGKSRLIKNMIIPGKCGQLTQLTNDWPALREGAYRSCDGSGGA